MNEQEFKAQLREAGAQEEAIAKINFAKIESIIDGASSIEDLCKGLKKAYPDFNEADFKKTIAANSKDSDDTQDLSDEALEAVAGGSAGSWLKKNKDWLIPVASLAIGGAIIGTGILLKNCGGPAARGSTPSIPDVTNATSEMNTTKYGEDMDQWAKDIVKQYS